MRYIIYPYKMGSQSAKSLANALGAKRVYPDRNYRPKPNDVIINWGNSRDPNWYNSNVQWRAHLNDVEGVLLASSKLKTFLALSFSSVSIPEFTTDIEEVKQWNGIVVCRQTVYGHSGQGIVLANSPEEIIQAPLYTKHLRHKHEYRVHVMGGEVIDYSQKKKIQGFDSNSLIRNHHHGWVFARENVILPEDAKLQACNAVRALGLDFGAVDVAYRERENKAYVLEINTAPGIEGTTVQRYADSIRRLYGTT